MTDAFNKMCKDLETFDYGFVTNDGVRHVAFNHTTKKRQEIDWKKYRLIPPEFVEKYRIGTCWDLVHYQYDWVNKNLNGSCDDRFTSLYFWCHEYGETDEFQTHTMFTRKAGNGILWYESSWGECLGTHRFMPHREFYKFVEAKMREIYPKLHNGRMYEYDYPKRFWVKGSTFINSIMDHYKKTGEFNFVYQTDD